VKLDPKEARLISQLRHTPTCKMTIVKYGGEIKAMKTEIDADLADKAAAEAQAKVPRGTHREIVKISEPVKEAQPLINIEPTRTQEALH